MHDSWQGPQGALKHLIPHLRQHPGIPHLIAQGPQRRLHAALSAWAAEAAHDRDSVFTDPWVGINLGHATLMAT